MARVTICGDAVVVKSAVKFEDIQFIEKYKADALVLMGGEDNKDPIFAIGTGETGTINKFGATFSSASRDAEGLAMITLVSDIGTDEDVKSIVADEIGEGLTLLNKLEAQIPSVLEGIKAERQAVMDSITIAQ